MQPDYSVGKKIVLGQTYGLVKSPELLAIADVMRHYGLPTVLGSQEMGRAQIAIRLRDGKAVSGELGLRYKKN